MDRRMNADAPEDGLNFARLDTDVTCGTRPAYATHLTKKPGMLVALRRNLLRWFPGVKPHWWRRIDLASSSA